ncbi:MAG: SoxR reducing system RseC family protein [Pseudomonadota bacterium]
MMEENARVVAVDGDAVWVETQRNTTCGACSLNKGCGTAVLAKFLGTRRTRIKALNTLAVQAGDDVVIGLRENALLQGSLAVYAVPLLAMLIFALFGEALNAHWEFTQTEAPNILFGLGGLAVGFFWLRRYALKVAKDARYQPVVLRHAGSGRNATQSPGDTSNNSIVV